MKAQSSRRRHKRICASRGVALLSGAFFLLGLIGCSSALKLTANSSPRKSTASAGTERVRLLEKKLRNKEKELQTLKERNWVLEARVRSELKSGDSAKKSDQVEVPAPAAIAPRVSTFNEAPEPQRQQPATVQNVGTAQTGEHFLYSKVLDSYRNSQAAELEKSVGLLLKTYPDSVFADNALYLAGLLAMESEQLPRAMNYMNQVIRRYPKGNKAVSALFAKGVIQKRQKNHKSARQSFEQVQVLYPGSPEATRVAIELKLLTQAKPVSGRSRQ